MSLTGTLRLRRSRRFRVEPDPADRPATALAQVVAGVAVATGGRPADIRRRLGVEA
jgi:hypothetical protein